MRLKLITIIAAITIATGCLAQRRYVIQHKPYIDLRPMHFGSKHIKFMNLAEMDAEGKPKSEIQDMKNTYLAVPVDL